MFCLLVSLVHFKADLLLSGVQREIPSFPHQVNRRSRGLLPISTKAPACSFPRLLSPLKNLSRAHSVSFFFPFLSLLLLFLSHGGRILFRRFILQRGWNQCVSRLRLSPRVFFVQLSLKPPVSLEAAHLPHPL